MNLIPATISDIDTLMSWFTTKQHIALWGGPNFTFPFTKESFIKDSKIENLASFKLINENKELLAFGQYYERLNCCHLGRLVVNPNKRGEGLGRVLVNSLIASGTEALKLNSSSLFVLADNQTAFNLYQSCGFELQNYPEKIELENCLYLVKCPNLKHR